MRTYLCLVAAAVAGAALGQSIFTADFTPADGALPEGWQFISARGECSGVVDTTEPAGGSSIRLDVPADETARATWAYAPRIAVQPETCYRLSFKVMLATPGGQGAYVIVYENGYEGPTHWHMTPRLGGMCDWHEQTITFKTRPDCEWLKLQCKLWEAVGSCWYDDLKIELIPEHEFTPAPSTVDYQPDDDGSPLQLLFYPAHRRPDRTLYLLDSAVNPIGMFFWGQGEQIDNPHLIIEAPPALRMIGPVVAGRSAFPDPFEPTPEVVERDGQQLSRWRVPIQVDSLTPWLKPDASRWDRYHFTYARPEPGCPESFILRWYLETRGRGGPEHEIAVRVVERDTAHSTPPPDFRLFTQHSDALRLPTADGRDAVLDYLHYAGIGGGLALSYYGIEYKPVDEELDRKGYFTWTWAWHGYGGAMEPGQQIVYDPDAKSPRKLVCPQVQAERQEPFWSGLVEGYEKALERDRPWIIVNYEPPWIDVCFCERCRKAFAKWAGLSEADVLEMTPKQMRELPDYAWGRFRAHQNDLIIQAHVDAARQTDPDIKFGVCGPPWTQWHADHAMDIRTYEPEVFLHAPMIYTSPRQYAEMTRSTCENTGALVMPFLLASDVAVPNVFPSAADIRLNMLATALSGGDGAVLWVGIESLDGEVMNALRRSMQEIAQVQPYIFGGQRRDDVVAKPAATSVRTVVVGDRQIEMPSANSEAPIMLWAWESDAGRLVATISYDATTAHTLRVSGPGIASARSLLGPAVEPDGDAVKLHLEPGGVAALVW